MPVLLFKALQVCAHSTVRGQQELLVLWYFERRAKRGAVDLPERFVIKCDLLKVAAVALSHSFGRFVWIRRLLLNQDADEVPPIIQDARLLVYFV